MTVAVVETSIQDQDSSEQRPREQRHHNRGPGEWGWEVFRQVTIEGRSTHTVAALFGLPQSQITQVVEDAVLWIRQELPTVSEGMSEPEQQAVAQQLAVARLDYLYNEAMKAWRESKTDTSYLRQNRRNSSGCMAEVESVRREQGNIRYLAAATQILGKMARLPASFFPVAGLQHSPERFAPPDGDCSPETVEQPASEPMAVAEEAATDVAETTCNAAAEVDSAAAEPQLSVFAPVQPGPSAVERRSTQGPSASRPLNRHERRARQKMLQRQLRKAK